MNISGFRKVFDIVAKHSPKGEDVWPLQAAEHDIVYFALTEEQVPEDSDDGKVLKELGCHLDYDCWAKYV